MDCSQRHDVTIRRGDNWELLVGMARGWEDINGHPSSYEARFALREEQNDDFPDVFTTTARLTAAEDYRFKDLKWVADFKVTPQETQSLPEYDLVCYCELRTTDGALVRRLFNGRAKIAD